MIDDVPRRDSLHAAATDRARSEVNEVQRLRDENEQLHRALISRETTDQAKGIIMATEGCTADAALRAMVAISQDLDIPLQDVAAALVYSASHQSS